MLVSYLIISLFESETDLLSKFKLKGFITDLGNLISEFKFFRALNWEDKCECPG